MKVAFYTLGCKVNQYETQVMTEKFKQAGFEIVSSDEPSDVYIVNSCTVTQMSDRKTRQAVRRFKRNNPDSAVVLTGCMPQAFPESGRSLPEADIVLGNRNTDILIGSIDEYMMTGQRVFNIKMPDDSEKFEDMTISSFEERTRAFVKIEDGCNCFCSYCIIPIARGRVRSKPLDELKSELSELEKAGYKEVVLVGINLTSYGMDIGCDLSDAVGLACSFEGIKRVRLGSLEPDHITNELIKKLGKYEKLCPQFHVSLQSGCDRTLKRMNRHYTSEEFLDMCYSLRKQFNDCAITTDIIVGFAGETEEDFEQSLAFAEKAAFSKIHVFQYSVRTGTRAAEFTDQVSKSDKEKRSKKMSVLADRLQRDSLYSHLGKTVSVLFETMPEDGVYIGHTPDYTQVRVKHNSDIRSQILHVVIKGVENDYCTGSVML